MKENRLKTKSARLISEITNAPIIAIPVLIIINYYLDPSNWLFYSVVSIFFMCITPTIIGVWWSRRQKVEVDMPVKEDRVYPLLMIIFFYILGVITLYYLNAPPFTTALMFCYLSNSIVVFFITLHWKISIHAIGFAGPAGALIYLFGYWGIIFTLILPLVMWSRVYLKRHTVGQVVVGGFLGLFLTYGQLYIIFNLLS
jgi:membrane-associated phospholipid phosphatase